MEWNNYRECILEHQIYIRKMKVFNHYSQLAFESFPKNLPQNIGEEWFHDLKAVLDALGLVLDSETSTSKTKVKSQLFMDKFIVMINNIKLGREETLDNCFNFEELISSHSLVMVYARLDAFYHATLLGVCRKKPRILNNQIDDFEKKNQGSNIRSLTFQQILDLGSYNSILETMIDDFLYKLGMKSLESRVLFLKEKLCLDLDISDIDLQLLYEGEKYRHSIIHRGGLVDERLLNTVKKEGLKIGDSVPVDNEFLKLLYKNAEKLMVEIFKAVSKKFYKMDDKKLRGVIPEIRKQ
ncbi:hypothetical protein [Bacillus cereus]|uniref:hypothetical protein n=1 Tax=Bacillus cereus TaxID=1396 RepID=UPI000C28A524|nr:hypothetical protein [Bacillus cereus]